MHVSPGSVHSLVLNDGKKRLNILNRMKKKTAIKFFLVENKIPNYKSKTTHRNVEKVKYKNHNLVIQKPYIPLLRIQSSPYSCTTLGKLFIK